MNDLFQRAAWYYARYRPFYPDEVIEDIVRTLRLGPNDRVIDIGSGTGQLAVALAKQVREVVAIDPDAGMIAEGKLLAEQHGVKNIHWIESVAEEIDKLNPLDIFRAATFGASFHWLDRALVLKLLDPMIEKDGGVAITAGSHTLWNKPEPWEEQVKQLIQKYVGQERRAGSGVFKKSEGTHEEVLAQSPFPVMQERTYPREEVMSIDEVVGHIFSTSFANPAIFGDQRQAFEDDLRKLLLEIMPSGKLNRHQEYFVLFGKRS